MLVFRKESTYRGFPRLLKKRSIQQSCPKEYRHITLLIASKKSKRFPPSLVTDHEVVVFGILDTGLVL